MSNDHPTRTSSATSQDTPAPGDQDPYRPPSAEGAQLPPTPFRRLRIVSVLLDVMGSILLILGAICGGLLALIWLRIGLAVSFPVGPVMVLAFVVSALVFAGGLGAILRRRGAWWTGVVLLAIITAGGLLAVGHAWHAGAQAPATLLSVLLLAFGIGGLVTYRLGAELFGAMRITRRELWAADPRP